MNIIRVLKTLPIMLLLAFSPIYGQKEFRVVGYLPHYKLAYIDSIDFNKLTHVCIGFANPDEFGDFNFERKDIWPAVSRAKQAGNKVLISIAGGGLRPDWIKSWKRNLQPQRRGAFIRKIIELVFQYDADGIDVDLEWSNVNQYYSDFVLELKRELIFYDKLMTAALPGKHRYPDITDEALAAFDFINVMAYDLTGHWDPKNVRQHSPYSFAVNCIDYWLSEGVPAEKLNLGLPFYGWDFTSSRKVKSIAYGEMVAADTTFAHLDQIGKIFYNGKTLIETKTQLAMDQVGGVMIWELGQDDYNEFSLLSAIDILINPEHNKQTIQRETQVVKAIPSKIKDKLSPFQKTKPNSKIFLAETDNGLVVVREIGGISRVVLEIPSYPSGIYAFTTLLKNDYISLGLIKKYNNYVASGK